MDADLESFLKEVTKHVTPKEPTLFAVGGRGYYENPASDLLKFFLKPKAEHRLGDLFLSTYLDCMGADHFKLDTKKDVDVWTQVKTSKGNFIDLQILGSNWCLIIENKINHWDANPFTDYENHAKGLGKEPMLFSILSPDGHSKDNNGKQWVGVSYLDYCKALRQKMPEVDSYNRLSKWQLFAREFILHLKNELYNPPMKPEQVTFVEEHAAAFDDAQKLLQQYHDFLCYILIQKLEEALKYQDKIEIAPTSWAILIKSQERWGNAYIAFRPPTKDGNKGFHISIYPDEGGLKRGQANENQRKLLEGMKHNEYFWETVDGFKNRDEAIQCFIPKIKLIERPSPGSIA
jgi:hypothetical protein